jgi:hypothetical protein
MFYDARTEACVWGKAASKPESKREVIRRTLLTATSLLVLACASEAEKIWYKAGATEADFSHASQYCLKYAGVSAQPTKAEMARFATCMEHDGWAQVPKPQGTPTQVY